MNRHWQTVAERKRLGLFLTGDEAATAAAQRAGHEVEIAVQNASGELM